MVFEGVYAFLGNQWTSSHSEDKDKQQWEDFIKTVEEDRQRDRIIMWRDRVGADDHAVNMDQAYNYRRTASGFVWRYPDPSGQNKARSHQYLYNLEVYGHKVFSRRSKEELQAAEAAVASRVAAGELGPLSLLA